jgi:hypothetical protein
MGAGVRYYAMYTALLKHYLGNTTAGKRKLPSNTFSEGYHDYLLANLYKPQTCRLTITARSFNAWKFINMGN